MIEYLCMSSKRRKGPAGAGRRGEDGERCSACLLQLKEEGAGREPVGGRRRGFMGITL